MTASQTLELIHREIASAHKHYCIKTPPDFTPPHIIAVSKKHSSETITPFLEAGHMRYGENRVQEAHEKWPALRKQFPQAELHLIGPLQTNKLDDAIRLFDWIHTVDREKLAKKLSQALQKSDHTHRTKHLLIQINTGEESQKSGILPKDADEFITFCLQELALPIRGLMCIPPVDEPAALHFELLSQLAERHQLSELSMGMSSDFALASTMGSTMIRVGTALFGKRPD